ncbi:zinc finger protein 518B [Parambassis ranga]|uniref:Zinc finger protein 518B n=1 Tax=Parambassis ranga TaxID=210632 RepID=A0A6P7J9C9_9TELE|nr:zinc finger protein 518B-like [Parambassis ranga]
MKPVSYQCIPSSVNGGHPTVALDRVVTTSNVMCCEKCGFASTDAAVFGKHMMEHTGMRFYCFYCNNVSFSEAELNEHLKQHTSKYPFKCPHCGQGYMRRLCLVKHIDRLHSKNVNQGPAKPGMTKHPQVPVSSALTSVPTADPPSYRPFVRVTLPTPGAPAVRLGKDEQRAKTLDTNVSSTTNGNAQLVAPMNGLIQHNRALTVSLPEEVTLPAGCLVELVEVKTVNGTKELKLRLVSQQENESVIKDSRTVVSQNTVLGKPLSSTVNHPNTARSMSTGTCTLNRKQCETNAADRPAVLPVSISNNPQNLLRKETIGLKRTSQEIINLECNKVIPVKIPKNNLNSGREGSSGIRVTPPLPGNHNAAPMTVISNRGTSRLSAPLHPDSMGSSVSQRMVDERKNLIPEHSKSIPPRRVSETKNSPCDLSVAVKLEPEANCHKTSITPKTVSLTHQSVKTASPSLNVPIAAPLQGRAPATLASKDNTANHSFSQSRTLNKSKYPGPKIPFLYNHTNSKVPTWAQECKPTEGVKEADVSEPESFPVISSVFSLSQQTEDVQGSIQPLVMALRGIVMDKSKSSGSAGQDHIKIINSAEQVDKPPTSGHCAEVATQNGSFTHELLLTDKTSQSLKVEEVDTGIQPPSAPIHEHIHIKEEKSNPTPTDNNKCSPTPASKPSAEKESNQISPVEITEAADTLQQVAKSELDVPLKFPTVSLKRVQVGVWKKSKKGLKLRISKYKPPAVLCSVTDCTVIYLMPLKVDQPVKRPGPNQPVVVLNHPKPRISVQGTGAVSFSDTGASEVVPKCQILKMRLSKVMGQKYEVMGCTVRVFP